ncbi:MAG: helix-turn-helix domain-containing protein [Clostridia bacterium]|nr:helix-turn-helix domain-containing protein [Clostridia bacterium]
MNYGEKISRLRKSKGMTQEELGKVLNVTYQAVSKWERGESQPDFETMSQIAKYFQVPLNYFADDEVAQAESVPAQAANAQPAEASAPAPNYIGMCTQCGKMLQEEEVASYAPKIICKSCSERKKQEALQAQQRAAEEAKRAAAHEAYLERGSGIDAKLIISLVITLACYILFTVICFTTKESDKGFYAAMLAIVPLAVFGCIHAFADFINDLRSNDDGPEGYTRNLSLIIAAAFAVINVVLFLVLYLSFDKQIIVLVMLFLGAILSFTFVSQFLWGGVVKDIFTAGGFTFKLPGFIFSLSIDSILLMIIAKFVLAILAAVVFVATTVFMTLVAVFGSVFTFIPSLLAKTVKDRKYKKV